MDEILVVPLIWAIAFWFTLRCARFFGESIEEIVLQLGGMLMWGLGLLVLHILAWLVAIAIGVDFLSIGQWLMLYPFTFGAASGYMLHRVGD